ncbi:GNAT family N-acetyltransferase [Fictibacillus nanhaiensis]|uniref:GNAT family N-acetyltransferase n=1 Tax=Fictibacillus nanhaiensis TaxID=742169 RepID=UPI001C954A9D|nr:GNAT family N-acetyltransferase [Fictibacillus nanhaiensis]MBY6038144.1 GNAT family N-acetyltransferase [Fictibacillus nanhaiensis]
MEIRLLAPPDAKKYWDLRLEALKINPEAFSTSYEESVQRKNPIEQVTNRLNEDGSFTFGAFQNNELIGVVTLVAEKTIKMKHRGNIYAMYITPDYRNKGTGRAILNEAINHAKTIPNIIKLNLTVVSTNKNAKKLYTSLGFKTFGFEEKALKVKETYYDEELMVLFLNKNL